MAEALLVLLAMAYGYLVGSIPTAYLAGRLKRGIDIRQYGSGNIGASNVTRHLGKPYFFLVFTADIVIKGVFSARLPEVLGLSLEHQVLAALLAVIGHNWSVYLGFSGGRGVAVGIGGLVVLSWQLLLSCSGIFFLGWIICRSAPLRVAIGLVLLPLWALLLGESVQVVTFCMALLLLIMLKRILSNPGTAPAGLRWRDMVITRLLYDRDIPHGEEWVSRTPHER
jgi:glycerol-3-phosphate acyltransferase PlsY